MLHLKKLKKKVQYKKKIRWSLDQSNKLGPGPRLLSSPDPIEHVADPTSLPNPSTQFFPPAKLPEASRMESSAAGDGSSAADAATAAASSSSGPSTSASAFSGGGIGEPSATHYLAKRVLHGSSVQHVARGHFRSEHLWEIVLCKVCSPSPTPLAESPSSRVGITV
jgi:hypothetical protein